MIAVVRSELYRLSTVRSSALSLSVFTAFGIILSMIGRCRSRRTWTRPRATAGSC